MAIMQVQQPNYDNLARISKLLDLAQAGYGIKTAYEMSKLRDIQTKQEQLKFEEEKAEKDADAAQRWTQKTYTESVPADPWTVGAVGKLLVKPKFDPNNRPLLDALGRSVPDLENSTMEYRIPFKTLQGFEMQSRAKLQGLDIEKRTLENKKRDDEFNNIFSKDRLYELYQDVKDVPFAGAEEVWTYDMGKPIRKFGIPRVEWAKQKEDRNYNLDLMRTKAQIQNWKDRLELDKSKTTNEEGQTRDEAIQARFDKNYEKDVSKINRSRVQEGYKRLENYSKDIIKDWPGIYEAKKALEAGNRGVIPPDSLLGVIATVAAQRVQSGVLTDSDFKRGSLSPQEWMSSSADEVKKKLGQGGATQQWRNLEAMMSIIEANMRNRWNSAVEDVWRQVESENDDISIVTRDRFKPRNPFDIPENYKPQFNMQAPSQTAPAPLPEEYLPKDVKEQQQKLDKEKKEDDAYNEFWKKSKDTIGSGLRRLFGR